MIFIIFEFHVKFCWGSTGWLTSGRGVTVTAYWGGRFTVTGVVGEGFLGCSFNGRVDGWKIISNI